MAEMVNFKKLWNKKYADIVGHKIGHNVTLTPEQFMTNVVNYFEWAENNALNALESAPFQGVVRQSPVKKTRVFTWEGLRLYCCISHGTLCKYKKTPGYDVVYEFAESVIREQKYQLAANGIISSPIAIRDLFAEGETNETVEASKDVTKDEFKEAVKDILEDL